MAPNVKDKDLTSSTEEDNGRNRAILDFRTLEEEADIPLPKKEILYDGYFYDVTSFVDRHPGGGVIEYYTQNGEDATVPILEFHNRARERVDKIMRSLPRRKAREEEMYFGGDKKSRERYKEMTEDFVALHKQAEAEGLFRPVYWRNFLVVLEVTVVMMVGGWIVASHPGEFLWKAFGAVVVGLGMGRMGLLQHECGHNSVSGNPKMDKVLQNVFYGFYMGMSAKWWVRRHNRHHAMPQRYQRDFDMEHLPVVATHEHFVSDPKNLAQNNVLTRNQGLLLPLNGTLFICAINFYYHPHYIIKRRFWDEMISLAAHFGLAWWTIGVWPYILAKAFMSLYLSSSFALNHTHLPITYSQKHWLEFGLNHTANVTPNLFNDWWLILLNYQIEHHLFPTMPQYNLRFVVDRVKVLAKKYELDYQVTSLPEAYHNTLGHVWKVQDHVRGVNRARRE